MNRLTIFSFISFCLFQTEVKCLPAQTSGDILVLNLISGALMSNISATVNVYALNAHIPLTLPLNHPEKKNITYFEFSTIPLPPSFNPKFDQFMHFPSGFFSTEAVMAIELWEQKNPTVKEYVGGEMFTIGQLEKMPRGFNLVLRSKEKQNVGSILIAWTN